MASLKVWHFFSNPSPTLSSSLVELSKVSATSAAGHVPITGWGLPDTSIIANAPAEYIVYLKVGLRKQDSDDWTFYEQSFRCNSKAQEPNNIFMFMPLPPATGTYETTRLRGTGKVTFEADHQRWRIHVGALAYMPNNTIHDSQNSSLVSPNAVSLQGVNIYY